MCYVFVKSSIAKTKSSSCCPFACSCKRIIITSCNITVLWRNSIKNIRKKNISIYSLWKIVEFIEKNWFKLLLSTLLEACDDLIMRPLRDSCCWRTLAIFSMLFGLPIFVTANEGIKKNKGSAYYRISSSNYIFVVVSEFI